MKNILHRAWGMGRRSLRCGLLALCALPFAVGGCATSQIIRDMRADPGADLFEVVRKVAVEDLQAAFIDAEAHGDDIAAVCYAVLLKYAQKERQDFEVKGAFSAFQRARDLRAQISGGVPTDLRIGCSALMLDTRDFILRIAALSRGATIP